MLLMLSLTVLANCSKPVPDVRRDVQAEFDSNPKLRERGIVIRVLAVENGYVTANIEAGLSPKAAKALNEGRSLNEIYFFTDTAVGPLIGAEEILKKKAGIKAVMWTAKSAASGSRKR
jgi:hypothetical protein